MSFVNGWVLFPLLELKIIEYNKNNKNNKKDKSYIQSKVPLIIIQLLKYH